jgi:hypothetical protein
MTAGSRQEKERRVQFLHVRLFSHPIKLLRIPALYKIFCSALTCADMPKVDALPCPALPCNSSKPVVGK